MGCVVLTLLPLLFIMGERGHESPMDFQWDGTGPSDPNSPYRMSALNNTLTPTAQKKRKYKTISWFLYML